jgi:imidazole glycerol-phosphate synthase subunit HisH
VSRITVGIVDYGIGNHSSVRHTLNALEMRCRISDEPAVLDGCDLLLLPGVGAFRPAIEALRGRSLDRYLLEQAARNRPLLGICLGMQLLAQASNEDGFTTGLGLVPGEVASLAAPHWHIGWNVITPVHADPLFRNSEGEAFYFNHSYAYRGPPEYQVCRTTAPSEEFVSAIRRDRIVGVQFHPEKSQAAGRVLLRDVIRGLRDA